MHTELHVNVDDHTLKVSANDIMSNELNSEQNGSFCIDIIAQKSPTLLQPRGRSPMLMRKNAMDSRQIQPVNHVLPKPTQEENSKRRPYGRRKALLIGICYDSPQVQAAGTSSPKSSSSHPVLPGAHEDLNAMQDFLMQHRGWPADAFTILKDDYNNVDSRYWPTRANILREMDALVEGAQSGDHLFFHFSGHGSQITDLDGDEVDGLDEVILTCDNGEIVDDELHEQLVRKLPKGCQMTVVFDCCSSGTAMDLPYFPGQNSKWFPDREEAPASPVDFSDTTMSPVTPVKTSRFRHRKLEPAPIFFSEPAPLPLNPLEPDQEHRAVTEGHRPNALRKYSSGEVVMWASCRDGEESGEVYVWSEGKARGAMTQAFIESMTSPAFQQTPTYIQLYQSVKDRMQSYQLQQNVLLSSSYEVKMNGFVTL